jgi:hypothetical protein
MKRTIKKLSVAGLVKFLTNDIGTQSRFINVEAITEVVKIKKNNPFGKVFKRAIVNGWVNFDYSKAVAKKVANKLGIDPSEVEYVPGESWHIPLLNNAGKATPVHVNKAKDDGKFYLFYRLNKTNESGYFDESGKEIAYADIKPFLYAASKPSEFKPKVNCLTLNNVTCLKAMGMDLVVA